MRIMQGKLIKKMQKLIKKLQKGLFQKVPHCLSRAKPDQMNTKIWINDDNILW